MHADSINSDVLMPSLVATSFSLVFSSAGKVMCKIGRARVNGLRIFFGVLIAEFYRGNVHTKDRKWARFWIYVCTFLLVNVHTLAPLMDP